MYSHLKVYWLILFVLLSVGCSTTSVDEVDTQSEKELQSKSDEKHNKHYFVIKELVDGYPKIKIVNNALKQHVNKSEFPWNLRIVIELDEPRNDGTPTKQEEEYLDQFQEFVEEKLSRIGDYKYVGQLTWNSERRIEYYISDPGFIEKFLTAMIETNKINNKLTFDIQKDEKWENYARFYKL